MSSGPTTRRLGRAIFERMEHVGDAIKSTLSTMDALGPQLSPMLARSAPDAVLTGIPSIDEAGGLARGDILVIAGPARSGKSSMALSVALKNCFEGVAVLYLGSSEAPAIGDRLISIAARVPTEALRSGGLMRTDLANVGYAAARLTATSLWIDRLSSPTASELARVVSTWAEQHQRRQRLVIIDVPVTLDRAMAAWASNSEMTAVITTSMSSADVLDAAGADVIVVKLQPGDAREVALVRHRDRPVALEQFTFNPRSGAFDLSAR